MIKKYCYIKCVLTRTGSKNKIKVELGVSSYATKCYLKNAIGVDTLYFAKKIDFSCLNLDIDKSEKVSNGSNSEKSKVDRLGVGKLPPIPVETKNLSHVVENDVVKTIAYNRLVKNVNTTQTTDPSNLVNILTITHKLVKQKTKYLIMIIINILLHKNLKCQQITLKQD